MRETKKPCDFHRPTPENGSSAAPGWSRIAGGTPPAEGIGIRDGWPGAPARIVFGKESGPVKEVQAGGGYWSQNSHTQIHGIGKRTPTAISVRWPGGKTTLTELTADTRDIQIGTDGKVVK